MEPKEYSQFSDRELLDEAKKIKSNNITKATLIGLMIGIATYTTIDKGFGFFTVFPIFFIFALLRKNTKSAELQQELKSRNLK